MLKPLATRFLQHLTQQNSWSKAYLLGFSGKTIQFDFVLLKANLIILEDGSLALGGETMPPEANIHLSPSLALRILAGDEAAKTQIKIDGDMHLATELAKVLQNMRWDYEDDLSQLVGDIPANKIGNFGRKTAQTVKDTSINLAEMLNEYWQEEKPMIAKKRHVEQFNADVDTLRADVARFEKRLAQLTKKTE
jgi:ubiquinone biosynthesis accessory factor UbiJ